MQQPATPAHHQEPAPESPLLTISQAARYFSKHEQTIHRWVRQGHVESLRVGGTTYVIKPEALR